MGFRREGGGREGERKGRGRCEGGERNCPAITTLPFPSVTSGGGANKPKSFLEIQQEQESDLQHHPAPPLASSTGPAKTLVPKTKV